MVASPHAAGSVYNMSKQTSANASIFDNLEDDDSFLRDTSPGITLRRDVKETGVATKIKQGLCGTCFACIALLQRQSALDVRDTTSMNVTSGALAPSPLIRAQIANTDRALPSTRAAGVDRTAPPIPLNLSQCETIAMHNDTAAIDAGGRTPLNETTMNYTIAICGLTAATSERCIHHRRDASLMTTKRLW